MRTLKSTSSRRIASAATRRTTVLVTASLLPREEARLLGEEGVVVVLGLQLQRPLVSLGGLVVLPVGEVELAQPTPDGCELRVQPRSLLEQLLGAVELGELVRLHGLGEDGTGLGAGTLLLAGKLEVELRTLVLRGALEEALPVIAGLTRPARLLQRPGRPLPGPQVLRVRLGRLREGLGSFVEAALTVERQPLAERRARLNAPLELLPRQVEEVAETAVVRSELHCTLPVRKRGLRVAHLEGSLARTYGSLGKVAVELQRLRKLLQRLPMRALLIGRESRPERPARLRPDLGDLLDEREVVGGCLVVGIQIQQPLEVPPCRLVVAKLEANDAQPVERLLIIRKVVQDGLVVDERTRRVAGPVA